jgi:hypothetical protein
MRATAAFALARRPFSARAAPGATVVSAFSSLKPVLSGVILRVHPDVLVGAGLDAAGAAANEASLSSLFRLFEGLRARAGDEKDTAAVGDGRAPLAGRYALDFWHRAPEGSRSALVRTKHAVSLSATSEAAFTALPRAAARAHWLELGLRALAPLAEATGVALRGSITLAPDIAAVVTADARKAASQPSAHFAKDAESALTESLLNFPPLDNEKFRAGNTNGSPSVFSRAAREARAGALLSRDGWLVVRPSTLGAAAAARLRRALVTHHDALHAYHPLWDGLRVCVARDLQWSADIDSGALCMPEDWTDAELVRFIGRHFSSLLRASLARARTPAQAKKP